MPRAHQVGFSRRFLAGVGFFENARCHGPGLALLTNGGVQQQVTCDNPYLGEPSLHLLDLDLWETDHLTGTSAHAPQRPMVTYTRMGTEGSGPHVLLRH
ncbi:hypothetical protein TNCV_3051691 [Trichonephila clavipes]|nr:hypothetical protein TNCV_3051691 [Trichonephila clavipes]